MNEYKKLVNNLIIMTYRKGDSKMQDRVKEERKEIVKNKDVTLLFYL